MTDFTIIAGLPFTRIVRITDGKDIWATLGAFEVRSQVRSHARQSANLITNLHPFMSKAYGTGPNANDIEITWAMTGAQTAGVNFIGAGFYDLIVSDTGTTDAKAFSLLSGQLTFAPLITKQQGDS